MGDMDVASVKEWMKTKMGADVTEEQVKEKMATMTDEEKKKMWDMMKDKLGEGKDKVKKGKHDKMDDMDMDMDMKLVKEMLKTETGDDVTEEEITEKVASMTKDEKKEMWNMIKS